MKYTYRLFTSELKYEFHKLPRLQVESYMWGKSIEFRFLRYRVEFKYILKKYIRE